MRCKVLELKNIPTYINEVYRINLIKTAKERVWWISPDFLLEEEEAILQAKKNLGENNVHIYKPQCRNINDEGYCFSIDENTRVIKVKLRPKSSEELNERLLIVDNIACIYNHAKDTSNINVRFIQGIDKIEVNSKSENGRTIQINILDNKNKINNSQITESSNFNEKKTIKDDSLLLDDTEEAIFEKIQTLIKKLDVEAPGIRTNNRNIEINNILGIIGRPVADIDERLSLRWKIFGQDLAMEKEYAKYRKELEKIKKKYIINLGQYGKFIQSKDIESFEESIKTYRIRFKTNSINLVQEKISESRLILEKLIKMLYISVKDYKEDLKTCTNFELQNIIETAIAKFPKINDIVGASDIIINYSELSKGEIANKDFCQELLTKIPDIDGTLYSNLRRIIDNY
jgi:hypothetical protein